MIKWLKHLSIQYWYLKNEAAEEEKIRTAAAVLLYDIKFSKYTA